MSEAIPVFHNNGGLFIANSRMLLLFIANSRIWHCLHQNTEMQKHLQKGVVEHKVYGRKVVDAR